jgi:hypothetical protein
MSLTRRHLYFNLLITDYMKKLKLKDLKLQSFVTGMDVHASDTAKGGSNQSCRSCVDGCPTGLIC